MVDIGSLELSSFGFVYVVIIGCRFVGVPIITQIVAASIKVIAELFGTDRVQIIVEHQTLGLQTTWADVRVITGRFSCTFSLCAFNFFKSIEWHLLGKGFSLRIFVGVIDEELLGIGIADVL